MGVNAHLSLRIAGATSLPLLFRRAGPQVKRFQRPDVIALPRRVTRQAEVQQARRLWVPQLGIQDLILRRGQAPLVDAQTRSSEPGSLFPLREPLGKRPNPQG